MKKSNLQKAHEQKILEFMQENGSSIKVVSDQVEAITDYNLMMGVLLDPEEEANG